MLPQTNYSGRSLCFSFAFSRKLACPVPPLKVFSKTGIYPHNISISRFRLESSENESHRKLSIFFEPVWISLLLYRRTVITDFQKPFFLSLSYLLWLENTT